ncbi:hypothetical protein MBLNU459_g4713t1 [Dothideomycetes sp. NU459]
MGRQHGIAVPEQHAASILVPALKFGAMTGTAGVITGGVAGVIRNTPAVFFAAASGVQWFGLGTTFWGTRSFILQAWDTGKGTTPSDRTSASAIAGGVAGSGVGLLTRGPRNVVPGGIMFTIFGFVGQALYNTYDRTARPAPADGAVQKNFLQRLADKKWTPFTVLTDAEYEDMLKEKLLRLDAELAVVDDRIAELRVKDAQLKATPVGDDAPSGSAV